MSFGVRALGCGASLAGFVSRTISAGVSAVVTIADSAVCSFSPSYEASRLRNTVVLATGRTSVDASVAIAASAFMPAAAFFYSSAAFYTTPFTAYLILPCVEATAAYVALPVLRRWVA